MVRSLASYVLLLTGLLLGGCSAAFDPAAVSPAVGAVASIQGTARGGQAPIAGAAIYMFGSSSAGYGAANASLIPTTSAGVFTDVAGRGYVRTDANGRFDIPGDYSCPAGTYAYLVSLGGNPGLGSGVNAASGEMLALGNCSSLGANTSVILNEETTVAAAVALSPFITVNSGTISVATSPTNVSGLDTAFTNALNLVNIASGTPRATTPNGLGAIPVSELNSLADILASCVNTDGSLTTGGSSPQPTTCGTLFTATTPTGGTQPSNTLLAMVNIARYPGQNVATLYGLIGSSPPFSPTVAPLCNPLTGGCQNAPNDWTVAVVYTSGSLTGNPLNGVNYLALDSKSNVWAVSSGHALQLSPTGTVNFNLADQRLNTNNYNQVLAVDLDDSVWFDENSYAVGKITRTGTLVCSLSGYIYCSMPGPGTSTASVSAGTLYLRGYGGVAIHPASNHLWAGSSSNEASAMVEVDTNEAGLASYTRGSIINPTSVAVDTSGNIWFPSQKGPPSPGGTVITAIDQAGNLLAGSPFSGGGLNGPIAIAFDRGGNAWAVNQTGNSLSVFDRNGAVVSGSPIRNGGVNNPGAIAVDGDNHVWVANFFETVGVAEFDAATRTPISPSSSFYSGYYTGSEYTEIGAVGVDASGDVWMASWGTGSINELIGAGAPTVNPVVLATKNGTIGMRP